MNGTFIKQALVSTVIFGLGFGHGVMKCMKQHLDRNPELEVMEYKPIKSITFSVSKTK